MKEWSMAYVQTVALKLKHEAMNCNSLKFIYVEMKKYPLICSNVE